MAERQSQRRNSDPSAPGAGLLRQVGGASAKWVGPPPPLVRFDRRPAPNVRGARGSRPKCRRRLTRCLSVHFEAKHLGPRLFEYVVPSCFNSWPFAMIRRPQSPTSSLSHFHLPEVSSRVVMSPKAEASGHARPTRPSSDYSPTRHTSRLPLPAFWVLDPRNSSGSWKLSQESLGREF